MNLGYCCINLSLREQGITANRSMIKRTWQEQGLDAPAVVGRLAASLQLVPEGSRLTAEELRQELSHCRLLARPSLWWRRDPRCLQAAGCPGPWRVRGPLLATRLTTWRPNSSGLAPRRRRRGDQRIATGEAVLARLPVPAVAAA